MTPKAMQTTPDSLTNTGLTKQTESKANALNASVVSPTLLDSGAGRLSESDDFIDEINCVIKPPRPLRAGEVYVRAMLLVSDARNQHGGRFPVEELSRVAELALDTPVLVGHRKDRLPIARVFRAELVIIDGRRWVKTYLYWLKESAGAETLRANIDGGVYKDCSLGFTFARAECSVCQADIRFCGHKPQPSSADEQVESNSEAPFFYYRGIERALEISLVYRGANPGARVGVDLDSSQEAQANPVPAVMTATWLAELDIERIADVTDTCAAKDKAESCASLTLSCPLLEGLPLLMGRHNGETIVLLDDGRPAPQKLSSIVRALCNFENTGDDEFLLYARLIGMRGKSKRSGRELIKFLAEDGGPVRSLKLRTLALLRSGGQWLSATNHSIFQNTLRALSTERRSFCAVQPSDKSAPGALRRETESLMTIGAGRFRITRRRIRPLVHARITGSNTVTVPLCSGDESGATPDSLCVTLPASHDTRHDKPESVVALAFDRLSHTNSAPRLINPRVVGRFGAYHTAEVLLAGAPSESCSDTNSQPLILPTVSHFSAGVVKLQLPGTVTDRANKLSPGAPVTVQLAGSRTLIAHVIHLKNESTVMPGLLADETASVEPVK